MMKRLNFPFFIFLILFPIFIFSFQSSFGTHVCSISGRLAFCHSHEEEEDEAMDYLLIGGAIFLTAALLVEMDSSSSSYFIEESNSNIKKSYNPLLGFKAIETDDLSINLFRYGPALYGSSYKASLKLEDFTNNFNIIEINKSFSSFNMDSSLLD